MSNNSDLLKRLSSPENEFNKHYAAYMGKCTANKGFDKNQKAEIATDILAVLNNGKLVSSLIKELLINSGGEHHSVVATDCKLFLYERHYQDKQEMLLSYANIVDSKSLTNTYHANGGDVRGFAAAIAEHWMDVQGKDGLYNACADCSALGHDSN